MLCRRRDNAVAVGLAIITHSHSPGISRQPNLYRRVAATTFRRERVMTCSPCNLRISERTHPNVIPAITLEGRALPWIRG
jgi:hypothetical protein